MQPSPTTCLNLNEAFHHYQLLGAVRNVRPRARVCVQGSSDKIVKALLLVDYKTKFWEPGLAGAYAVAASFVMDGVNELGYQKIVSRAIAKHGRGSKDQSYRAELEAFCNAMTLSGAVCIQRDEGLIAALTEITVMPILSLEQTLSAIPCKDMYGQSSKISGISGEFSPEQISWLVHETLAVGRTTFTPDRLVAEVQGGEHAGWRA